MRMELPTCHKCGKPLLQWGRNLTVADGTSAVRDRHRRRHASMGPQLDSCGWRRRMAAAELRALLQWGRNLTVADGAAPAAATDGQYLLQWGRNLTVADGLRRASVRPPRGRYSDHSCVLSAACRALASSAGGAPPGIISGRRAAQGPSPLTVPLARPGRPRPRSHHTTNDGLLPPPCCSRTPIVSTRSSEPAPYEGPTSTKSTRSWA